MNEESIKRFAEMILGSHSPVFFGGAGVSTESGVKDYRSKDGLYQTVKQYGVSPETILSHSFFFAHPDIFYDFYSRYFLSAQVQPNRAHRVLAELERRGRLRGVITQNIDGLHQAAGSRNVIELHGTAASHHCSACGKEYPTERIKEQNGAVPYCDSCGAIVKPDVVLYEEPLDSHACDAAVDLISNADLLIVGGTSLAVYPAAGYLRCFRGDRIVLINRDPTDFDSRAALVFRDPIGEVLSETLERMDRSK